MPIAPPSGELLYRFVVIADTHVNEADDRAQSFFALNRLANGRAAAAFRAAAALKPAFVMHVGDIVHPIPCSPGFEAAVCNYREMEKAFECPVYLTPGNHDIGDKRWPLAPVASIEPDFIRDYERAFGPQWMEWEHGPCRYFSLNTSLMNSGLPDEARQRDWFMERLAATGPGLRLFLALHYPPYLRDAAEPGHYDNIDEPARSWLLGLVGRHAFEAVFCGHVHNFWYDQHQGTELYLLPSTAFVRQDYSDLARVRPPGDEGGRQDADKLGFFLVDVFEQGHVARFMRCGQSAASGTGASAAAPLHATSPHPKRPSLPGLGVDLTYPWAEEVDLPPNAALDEFRRKRVRNDYPLLSLFELGVSLVRVPVEDLDDVALARRLGKLGATGIRAQIVVSGHAVRPEQLSWLRELGGAIAAVEWVLHEDAMAAVAPHVRETMARLDNVPLLVSKLRRPSDAALDGLKYGHLVFHGWVPQEAARICDMLKQPFGGIEHVGAVLRVRLSESPLALAHQAAELAAACRAPIALIVRMGTDNPATAQDSEAVLAERVVETAIAAWRYPGLRFIIDGWVDVDRGYFLRLGLIDRAFNPRRAAKLLRHLQPLLAQMEPVSSQVRCLREEAGPRFEIATQQGTLHISLAQAVAQFTPASAAMGQQSPVHYSLLDGSVLAFRSTSSSPTSS